MHAIETDENISEVWSDKKDGLAILLKHEDIDTVEEEIISMEIYLKKGITDEAENCKIRLKSYIIGIIDGEKLNISNIF